MTHTCTPDRLNQKAIRNRRGAVGIYIIVIMVALCALTSLAVDVARVQIVKTELQRGADAAARAGISGIDVSRGEAAFRASTTAQLNHAEGAAIALATGQDVEYWKWDLKTGTGQKLSGASLSEANALRVVARRVASRGTAVPMHFAQLVGFNQCDVQAEAIVMRIAAVNVNEPVLAVSNPFLAGMPKGFKASAINPSPRKIPDVAGDQYDLKNSPKKVPLAFSDGEVLTFDSIDGTARHDPNDPYFSPDGKLSDIGHNNSTTKYANNYGSQMYNENGIADMWAPINTLVGVFLDDNAPNTSPAPENLDFRTAASRDFSVLQPKLKQIFFIGDGRNSSGAQQEFVVPKGATRLYLATWDFYEWNNNDGTRTVKVERPGRIITVR